MKHATIKNYQQALDYLGRKRNRPYAHNTRVILDSLDMGHEVVSIVYHDTSVVTMFPNGTNAYNSGGWRTSTTKERLNWFLPDGFSLYQERGVWYLVKRDEDYAESARYIFCDGLAIDASGNVYNAGDEGENERIKKTVKSIKKYVDGYVKALLSGKVGAPSSGDCFYCVMATDKGENLGEATGSVDHIESHFEESYFVPSLLVNAHKFSNHMCLMAQDGVARLLQGESISDWQGEVVARDVRSTLTKYLKHVFGIAA